MLRKLWQFLEQSPLVAYHSNIPTVARAKFNGPHRATPDHTRPVPGRK